MDFMSQMKYNTSLQDVACPNLFEDLAPADLPQLSITHHA
jgi:hypothetical protein